MVTGSVVRVGMWSVRYCSGVTASGVRVGMWSVRY